MTKYPGLFITLEGPEGAGKTTQLKLLSEYLRQAGHDHLVTRDPGGTTLGKSIRRILLNPAVKINPITELLLYEADRAQNVFEIILPNLRAGRLVICDRYIDSTWAYQGYGRKLSFKLIETLNHIATEGLQPDLTILFDIDSAAGLARLHPSGQDRLEREALEFHQTVRNGYLELAKKDEKRWLIVDAARPLSQVQAEIQKLILKKLATRTRC